MATSNAINANSAGLVRYNGTGTFDAVTTTNHDVLIGATSNGITNVAPSATSGVPLISQGASADPTFGTTVVAGGGTGQTSLTNHAVLVGASTSAITQLTVGSNGQVLLGATGADPAFATLTSSDSSITFTTGINTLSLQVASGTTVGKTITGDSGGALSPTAGNWNLLGSGSITTSGSGSTLTTQLTGLTNHSVLVGAGSTTITKLSVGSNGQVLIGATSADPAFATLTSSDSSITFTTGANTLSLQIASGTTVGKTITGDSGGALSPTAGNWNLLGSGSITTVGSGSTLTTQLTGLTNHNVLLGAGTSTITKLAPSATSGVALISQGASSDPVFGTVVVAGGGTGATTLTGVLIGNGTSAVTANTVTNHAVLVGGTSNAITSLSVGATGTLLVGATTADPAFATSADGDFTFTSSTSGGTRTFTVNNTSNTANSAATIVASTAGATAGDAKYQATTTTTTWSWGVDNSVTTPTADTFVISQGTTLGTNNIMSVATSGEINYPLQPAFLVYLNADVTNVTGDGTAYDIAFDTEVFDQNSDVASGVLTAPVTGKYSLYGGVKLENVGAAHTQAFSSIVTSNREYRDPQLSGAARTSGNDLGMTISSLCDMDAADTAKLQVTVAAGTKVVGVGGSSTLITYFSGNLTV